MLANVCAIEALKCQKTRKVKLYWLISFVEPIQLNANLARKTEKYLILVGEAQ